MEAGAGSQRCRRQRDGVRPTARKAIRLDAKNAGAYGWRGFAYDEQGECDKAIADYTEAIRVLPASMYECF